MSELDKLKDSSRIKDYDLKTLKAKSNKMVALALEAIEQYMSDPEVPVKDKAQMGMKVVTNHIVILDKVEKLEFVKLNKNNLVLKNNKLLKESLEDDGSEYKKMVNTDNEPSLDLGLEFLKNGDKNFLS